MIGSRRRMILGFAALVLGLGAGSGAGAQTIHLVNVADTDDPNIGDLCATDQEEVSKVFMSNVPERQLNLVALWGQEVNRNAILGRIANLPIRRNDTVVFYYSGHGAIDQRQRHYISLPNDQVLYRSEVKNAILRKGPRLTVLLTDICSVMVPRRDQAPLAQAPFVQPPQEISPLFDSLFIRPRGLADINGSRPGELGQSDPKRIRGGLFTLCLVDLLSEDTTRRMSWNQFVDQLVPRVQQVFRELWPGGYDRSRDGLVGIQRSQTPYALELPGGGGQTGGGGQNGGGNPPQPPGGGLVFGATCVNNDGDGVRITRIFAGTPAERAGLEPQDVIVEINGRPIRSEADYAQAVDNSNVLMRLVVRNWRDGELISMRVRLNK